MHRGYIKLWRKVQDNFLWKEPRVFSRAEAWIDMIMEVQYNPEPTEIVIGNKVLTCHRGESLKSLDTWSKRWMWDKSATRRFLNLLKKIGQIETASETVTTRIKVINYDTYCPLRNGNDAELNSVRNACETQVTPDNKVNKEKKVNNINIYTNVIAHLNQKTGKDFRPNSKATQRLIKARLNDGFKEPDFICVINNQCSKWLSDPKMMEFLRPQTLFGPKFESYLNNCPAKHSQNNKKLEEFKRFESL